MTIVIQNWFENLHVDDKGFSIVLNFKNKPEKLSIPFESIISFSDPSVNFSLQFESSVSQNLETIMDIKEKDPQTQSDKDDSESEQTNNIIQFEKYKK
jgi:hypothetical protein